MMNAENHMSPVSSHSPPVRELSLSEMPAGRVVKLAMACNSRAMLETESDPKASSNRLNPRKPENFHA
jgi:hypothetical protein